MLTLADGQMKCFLKAKLGWTEPAASFALEGSLYHGCWCFQTWRASGFFPRSSTRHVNLRALLQSLTFPLLNRPSAGQLVPKAGLLQHLILGLLTTPATYRPDQSHSPLQRPPPPPLWICFNQSQSKTTQFSFWREPSAEGR
jgi:hypothetical protein